MVKRILGGLSLLEMQNKYQEIWEYIEDPTYSRSIDSHVCITCSKFNYFNEPTFGSILYCNLHQKLILQGQHLTHSCVQHEKKVSFDIKKFDQ